MLAIIPYLQLKTKTILFFPIFYVREAIYNRKITIFNKQLRYKPMSERETREPCPSCGGTWTYWNVGELVCRDCGAHTPKSVLNSPSYMMNRQFI